MRRGLSSTQTQISIYKIDGLMPQEPHQLFITLTRIEMIDCCSITHSGIRRFVNIYIHILLHTDYWLLDSCYIYLIIMSLRAYMRGLHDITDFLGETRDFDILVAEVLDTNKSPVAGWCQPCPRDPPALPPLKLVNRRKCRSRW